MKTKNYSTAENRLERQQENLAIANQEEAHRTVQAFRFDLEHRYGIPIVLEHMDNVDPAAGGVKSYWEQYTDRRCHSMDLPECVPWLQVHNFAFGLVHIRLECEAQAAGKRRTHWITCSQRDGLLAQCQAIEPLAKLLFNLSYIIPSDMVVESIVRRDFPVLAPAQWVNINRQLKVNIKDALAPCHLPPNIGLALQALAGVSALFSDSLFPGTTRHFAPFEQLAAGALATQLHEEFQTAFPNLGPAGHYQLVDRFAEILGFPALHDWAPEAAWELMALDAPDEEIVPSKPSGPADL